MSGSECQKWRVEVIRERMERGRKTAGGGGAEGGRKYVPTSTTMKEGIFLFPSTKKIIPDENGQNSEKSG